MEDMRAALKGNRLLFCTGHGMVWLQHVRASRRGGAAICLAYALRGTPGRA